MGPALSAPLNVTPATAVCVNGVNADMLSELEKTPTMYFFDSVAAPSRIQLPLPEVTTPLPTANENDSAAGRIPTVAVRVLLATVTTTSANRVGLQTASGTVICKSVSVAAVTDASSPSTVTVFSEIVPENPEPVMVPVAPSVQVTPMGSMTIPPSSTVITVLELVEPLVAVMVSIPSLIAVTSPASVTRTTAVSDDAHVIEGFEISDPPESLIATAMDIVSPSTVNLCEVGVISRVEAT